MYASGKWALALCDICRRQVAYKDLRPYVYNRKPNGWLVCPECCDKDNPQLWVGEHKPKDPQALRNPRPASSEMVSARSFWGWNPVAKCIVTLRVSPVTVTTT